MARLAVFALVLTLAISAGLILVSERAALTRVGYRAAEVERQRRELLEQNQQLQARVARLKAAAQLAERAASFQLDIVPPEESLKEKHADPPKRR